jgi:hypothetical protein
MGLHLCLPRSATWIKLSLPVLLPRYAQQRAPAHCLRMHWDMHILTRACACHVIEVMGLHLSRSAMRIKLWPS